MCRNRVEPPPLELLALAAMKALARFIIFSTNALPIDIDCDWLEAESARRINQRFAAVTNERARGNAVDFLEVSIVEQV